MKTCRICLKSKLITDFYAHKTAGDRHRNECKVCNDQRSNAWKKNNPERTRTAANARTKKWRIVNRDIYLEQSRIRDKARWQKRKDAHRRNAKRRRIANPELYRAKDNLRGKKYRDANRDKVRAYGRKADKKRKPQKTAYMRKRRRNDINFRMAGRLRTSLCLALQGKTKSQSALKLLGCSLESFKLYLESKWETGMSWENYSRDGWNVDHIMPVSIFDLSNREHQRRCFHYSNMQPMWAEENRAKSNKPPAGQFNLL